MRMPNAMEVRSSAWMDAEEFYSFDGDNGTFAVSPDAPLEVFESYALHRIWNSSGLQSDEYWTACELAAIRAATDCSRRGISPSDLTDNELKAYFRI